MGNVSYKQWLYEDCCNGSLIINNNCGCKDKDVCDCENILLELSKQHTDDEILQDEIDELSGKVEAVSATVDTKLDASAYTPVDLTNYATKQWVNDKGYITTVQPLKTINGESLVGEGNIVISGGSGSTITVDDHLDSASTNPAQNKVITEALNDKLDASAYTPVSLSGYATEQWVLDKNYITGVDLSDYALKSEIPTVPTSNSAFTNDMHYVTSAETANYVTSGNVETQIVNHFWCGTQTQWSQISGNTQPNVLYLIHD